jgi:site-specific DNA-methyltransferase (adenine-specific)
MRTHSVKITWEGKQPPPQATAPILYRYSETCLPHQNESILNRLILGDNLAVMNALLPSMRSAFRIIYADPPFATGKDFTRRIGREEDSRQPENWKLGAGFGDSWSSLEEYLDMLYPRLVRMHELLAEDGTLFLHLDWRAAPYARVLLDEIFGPQRLLNEIVWVYHGPSPVRAYFNRKHDTILVYAKGDSPCYAPDRVRVPYNPVTHKTFASSSKAGFGKQPDLERGKIPEDWWYFPVVARMHGERTGYPTQKPQALLERIVRTASNEGDWIGDFFCGSGTTIRVADTLARRWVGCDASPASLSICQRRLALGADGARYQVEGLTPFAAVGYMGESIAQAACALDDRMCKVTLTDVAACNPNGFPASLDYWEIDFLHDESCFRTMAQAARPWRTGTVPTTLSYRYTQPGEFQICVRVICADGNIASTKFSVVVR